MGGKTQSTFGAEITEPTTSAARRWETHTMQNEGFSSHTWDGSWSGNIQRLSELETRSTCPTLRMTRLSCSSTSTTCLASYFVDSSFQLFFRILCGVSAYSLPTSWQSSAMCSFFMPHGL